VDSSIKFNVSANTAQFQSGMRQVDAAAKSTAAGIKTAFAGVGSLLVGGAVAAGLKSLMNDFDRVGKLATRFGTSAESIQRVSVAADVAGTNIEQVAQAMTKAGVAASQAVEKGGTMAETFERAGINAQKFASAQLDQKLLMVSEAFAAAQGDASKTNAIIEILGTRAGANLIPLISNVQALKAEMGGVSVASDDMVRKIEAANDRLTRLGNDGKVAFAMLLEGVVNTSERLGSLLSDLSNIAKLSAAASLALTGNIRPLWELLQTGKTIKEMEEIEARASAIVQLTNEGVFGMDAEKNAALIAERTAKILEQTRGTAQQIQIAEDTTDRVLDIEKEKTAELNRQQQALERQEEQRQRSIRSMEQEIRLIEAQLSGNKGLEESLRQQADFDAAMEKTGSFETASNFAATKAAERAAQNRPVGESAGQSFSGQSFVGASNLSNLDLLRQAAETDPRARAELFRLQNEQARGMDRAGNLRERGMFGSAARAEMRAEARAERRASRFGALQLATDRFGGGNMAEAFANFRSMVGGAAAGSQRDFEKWANEQVKTEKEREREARKMENGKATSTANQLATETTLQKLISEIVNRLPQNALVAA
jgi:hypothetical protein